MEKLSLKGIHRFSVRGKEYFFDYDTLLVGELDSVSSEIVNILKERDQTKADITKKLTPVFHKKAITEAIQELQQTGVVSLNHYPSEKSSSKTKDSVFDLNSITLHIANDCNLRCSYCYGDGGNYSEERCLMDWSIAKESVDFLTRNSDKRKELSIVFFGGEPLMNFPMIKRTVEYCKELENRLAKKFIYSITTNGTMFNRENVEFMKENRFSILVSLDGTKEIHDRYRVFSSGHGSYDLIVKNLRKFFDLRKVSVRCTLPYHRFDLEDAVVNLKELGVGKAHFELADGYYPNGLMMYFYLPEIKRSFKAIASIYEGWLTRNASFALRNFTEFMRRIHFRERKFYGCGAAKGFVSVSAKGHLYPCHRMVGNKKFKIGDVFQVFSVNCNQIFDLKIVKQIPQCMDCIAKRLCAGGCAFSNYVENKDINVPNQVRCEITRHVVKLVLLLYVKLKNNTKMQEYFRKK